MSGLEKWKYRVKQEALKEFKECIQPALENSDYCEYCDGNALTSFLENLETLIEEVVNRNS